MSSIRNESFKYLFPLLSQFLNSTNGVVTDSIVNTYVKDDKHEGELFIIRATYSEDELFKDFEESIFDSNIYMGHYEAGNDVIYILSFPKVYIKEYYEFISSNLSNFGDDAKDIIVTYWNKTLGRTYKTVPKIKRIKQILKKDEELRLTMQKELNCEIEQGQELGEAFNLKKETYIHDIDTI